MDTARGAIESIAVQITAHLLLFFGWARQACVYLGLWPVYIEYNTLRWQYLNVLDLVHVTWYI